MATRALTLRNAVLALLRASDVAGIPSTRIYADLRDAIQTRPSIVVDMGDEDPPIKEYGQRRRAIALSVRILADGSDPFSVIDPIRIATHARILGNMTADGLLSGGAVTPSASLLADKVDTAALSCMLGSHVTTILATTNKSITRPSTNVAKVNSITVNSSGAIAVVAGTDGSTTAFSETRGAAGGPPTLPTGSIEVAQVRVTSSTPAVITVGQITAASVTLRALCDTLEEGASSRDRADMDVSIASLVTTYTARYTTEMEALT